MLYSLWEDLIKHPVLLILVVPLEQCDRGLVSDVSHVSPTEYFSQFLSVSIICASLTPPARCPKREKLSCSTSSGKISNNSWLSVDMRLKLILNSLFNVLNN